MTRHFLSITDFSKDELSALLDQAQRYADALVKGKKIKTALQGKVALNLFFENSTRTCTSFEMATYRLGGNVINWRAETSSLSKGESFRDTIQTVAAMKPDVIIMRHSEYNAPYQVSKWVDCPVVNAGDSYREHPTQALLDALTIRQAKGRIEGLTIAICGDIAHSRVASSNIHFLSKMGAKLRIIAPEFLMPQTFPVEGIGTFTSMEDGLPGCDIVMMLRNQKERMDAALIPDDATYHKDFGLTMARLDLAGPDALVMHPGPFNRGVEVADDVIDHTTRSLYLKAVANGVPARMAVLASCAG